MKAWWKARKSVPVALGRQRQELRPRQLVGLARDVRRASAPRPSRRSPASGKTCPITAAGSSDARASARSRPVDPRAEQRVDRRRQPALRQRRQHPRRPARARAAPRRGASRRAAGRRAGCRTRRRRCGPARPASSGPPSSASIIAEVSLRAEALERGASGARRAPGASRAPRCGPWQSDQRPAPSSARGSDSSRS